MKENLITEEDVKLLAGAISHETNLMYILARVMDTLMADIESRMQRVDVKYRIKGEVKKRLKEYIHLVEQCGIQFRNFVEPNIMESVNEDWRQYERTRGYANELIRLLMSYYETCTKTNDYHGQVFDLLNNFLENGKHNLGVFSVEDINRFDLGCR